jgi:hypothetical protein
MDAFAAHLAGNYVPNTVIVDATASSRLPERYMAWMQARAPHSRGFTLLLALAHTVLEAGSANLIMVALRRCTARGGLPRGMPRLHVLQLLGRRCQ